MTTSRLQIGGQEAIEHLVPIIGHIEGANVLFCTCIDRDGFVGDTECFMSTAQPLSTLPIDEIFGPATIDDAAGVLCASRAEGLLDEADPEFTSSLLKGSRSAGVELVDHIVVDGSDYRSMRATTDLWDS